MSTSPKDARRRKLAEALRRNLKRRKAAGSPPKPKNPRAEEKG